MPHFPKTRQSLLLRVQQQDRDAWTQFSEIYRPAIYRIIRRRGWQDADAQDITQLVLVKVSRAIQSFDPTGQARFGTWLTTICRNTLVDELRRQRSGVVTDDRGAEAVSPLVEDVSAAEVTREHRRQVFRWAAKQAATEFTTTTWEAFWETSVNGRSVQEIAARLELSVGAVYTARSRVMQRLKQMVQEYDDADV